jgi:tetratricopeptide (TPR) repeat protein
MATENMNRISDHSAKELEQTVWKQIQAGKLRDAAATCDRLNHQFPDYESGWHTSSQLAMRLNEPRIAVQAIDRALSLSPGKPEWLLQKTACLGATGDLKSATALALRLSEQTFATAHDSSLCGLTLTRLGMHADARKHYQRAVDLDPDTGSHHYNLASVHRFLGELDDAESSADRAIELDPGDYEAHLLRSGLKTQTLENNHLESLHRALEASDDSDAGRVMVHFALAKEYEDVGDYDASFRHLELGASMRRRAMDYRPDRDLETMRRIRDVYSADVFSADVAGHISAEPIFIIGMPRSGTTLVERILSSHSVVQSAGELQNFSLQMVKQCKDRFGAVPVHPAELVTLTRQLDFEALGEAYIASTRAVTGNSAHFIDKLPFNFLYAGLIHLALPKARIIWLECDPLDTCYAVFKTLFEGAYPFSYDLRELANYYVAYSQLMNHWQNVIPGVLHVVRYEELVEHPRSVIEKILEYCDLSWEQGCLRFYENEQASTTASAAQVRAAIYTSSIGKWRNFEEQLQPLIEILREANLVTNGDHSTKAQG